MLSVNLFVPDCVTALAFYEVVFGATGFDAQLDKVKGERNVRFRIGDDLFALADENPAWGSKSPITLGGVAGCLQLFVPDVDAVMKLALENGGSLMAPSTQAAPIITTPTGVQFCNIQDPAGHVWTISSEYSNP